MIRNRVVALTLLTLLSASTLIVVHGAQTNLQVAMWINDMQEIEETQTLLDGYMKANPGVKLELIQQPWSGYHDKMIALAAGGVTPDVMVLSRAYLPAFANNGIIRPVEQWLARENFDVKRDVTEMASGAWNGHQYGIPIWGGPAVMVYNTDMFELMGLPLPSQLSARKDWSWDRLIEVGRKLTRDTNGDGSIDVFALSAPSTWEPCWYTPIRVHGGDVIRGNRAVIDSPEAQRGLQLLSDLRWAYHITPQPGEPGGYEAGTIAMGYAWMSEAPNLAKRVGTSFRPDLVTMPTGPAGSFHVAGGCPVTVSSTTPYPEEAYRFAVWFAMFSDEWKLRGIPASMSTVRREYRTYLAQFFTSPDVAIEALSGPTAVEPSIHLKRTELLSGWEPILNSLFAGTISVKETCEQMARHIQATLDAR